MKAAARLETGKPNDTPIGARGVQVIEEILCRPIHVLPVLRAVVDAAEKQRIRLTAEQAKILRIIGGRRRAIVSGGAGTGKTLLAIEKARQLAQQGLTVLLLCYNRPLATHIAQNLLDSPSIKAQSYHQLCDQRCRAAVSLGRDLLSEARAAYPGGGDKHFFDVQMPFALALSTEIIEEQYDALVVDEAQDFSEEYWFGLELLLRDQENGHLYIFTDENQALYSRSGKLPIEDEPFILTANCRNSAPIYEAAYRFYKGEAIDPPELPGPNVIWSASDKTEAQVDAIARRIYQWITVEGIDAKDVVVLVAKRPKAHHYELIQQHSDLEAYKWAVEQHGRAAAVLLDTVARFKGLEAEAVILWLGDEVAIEGLWETVYVGLTRAKSLLAVVGSTKTLQAVRTYVSPSS